MSYKRNSV